MATCSARASRHSFEASGTFGENKRHKRARLKNCERMEGEREGGGEQTELKLSEIVERKQLRIWSASRKWERKPVLL